MPETLPDPPVPHDCNLRSFPYIPIEVDRLRRSKAWLLAKRSPEVGFYMMNLWLASWHEVPAASLEDDDDALADAAMCEPRRWLKIRAQVLRGWIKCSDGRLYHGVVAEKACEAWSLKQAQKDRTEAARLARQNRRALSVTDSATTPVTIPETEAHEGDTTNSVTMSVTENATDTVSDIVTIYVADNAADIVTGSNRKERKGKEKEEEDSDPNGSAELPLSVDPVKDMWDLGLRLLCGAGMDEKQARPLIGKWRREFGDAAVMAAIVAADNELASEPVGFITRCLANSRAATRVRKNEHGVTPMHPGAGG
jgi:hypothetical protein